MGARPGGREHGIEKYEACQQNKDALKIAADNAKIGVWQYPQRTSGSKKH